MTNHRIRSLGLVPFENVTVITSARQVWLISQCRFKKRKPSSTFDYTEQHAEAFLSDCLPINYKCAKEGQDCFPNPLLHRDFKESASQTSPATTTVALHLCCVGANQLGACYRCFCFALFFFFSFFSVKPNQFLLTCSLGFRCALCTMWMHYAVLTCWIISDSQLC